jgi:photosystem II stability/assembly factor-like uncharacterized protein
VGSAGRILETSNGGALWTPRTGVDTDGGRALRDIQFVDGLNGFIVGSGGLILRTRDGGLTWVRLQPGVTSADLLSVWATDQPGPDIVAWAVAANGSIVGTRNGGDSWSVFTPAITAQRLSAVVRRSTTEAIAVGFQKTVGATLASADSAIWVLQPPPADIQHFYGLSWPVATRAFGAGSNLANLATVVLSTDGGLTWTAQNMPSGAPLAGNALRAVWFVDANRGWAVGEQGIILHTSTGGAP